MIDRLSLTRCRFSPSRPEIYPLIKTGGLADVIGALPDRAGRARRDDADAGARLSGRSCAAFKKKKPVHQYAELLGGKAAISCARKVGELDLFVLDAPHLFDRIGGPYGDAGGKDWPDNWRRFAALSQVGARHRRRSGSKLCAGSRPRSRLAGGADAGLYAFRQGGRRAVGDHRPQPCLPGTIRLGDLSANLACRRRRWR